MQITWDMCIVNKYYNIRPALNFMSFGILVTPLILQEF